MINQLRHEACSGSIDDLAHVVSEDCMSDCLTKASAKSMFLTKTVDTGYLPNADKHPPFRELMRNKHKAYGTWECTDELISWLLHNVEHSSDVMTFFNVPVRHRIEQYLVTGNTQQDLLYDWWNDAESTTDSSVRVDRVVGLITAPVYFV